MRADGFSAGARGGPVQMIASDTGCSGRRSFRFGARRSRRVWSTSMRSVLVILMLALAGCATTRTPESELVGLGMRSFVPIGSAIPEYMLSEEFVYVQKGGQGILGDMTYRLLPGDYVAHGSDEQGTFYRHVGKGVIRSGNLGIAEPGGFYVPSSPAGRWGIWIVPRGNDVAIALLGPVAAAIPTPDRRQNAFYCSNITSEEAARLESLLTKKDSTAPQQRAGSGM
jgi:hypothetical protein